MPNWLQLVEHTAEFTPGVWRVAQSGSDGTGQVFVTAPVTEAAGLRIAQVFRSEEYLDALRKGGKPDSDPEGEANARLMVDAPNMLVLLASILNAHDMKARFPSVAAELDAKHAEMIAELLIRHVRIGCAPVDEENRALPPAPQGVEDMERFLREPWE